MLEIIVEYKFLFLQGFLTTLELILAIILVGVPFGTLLGILGGRYSRSIAKCVRGLKFLTKVTPVVVLLFWLHYPLQALLHIVIDPFWTTVIALGGINMIATAFIVQSELELLPRSYRDAGKTLGLSKKQIVQNIELPILLRRIAPTIGLHQATMLEYTLFASLISVPELFRVAQTINSMVYDPVAVYSLLVIFFFILLAPFHVLISFLQSRYKMIYA